MILDYLTRALVWADGHGLTVPVILAAVTTVARLAWAILRPVVLRRAPGAVPVIEGIAARVARLLPDILPALLRRPVPTPQSTPYRTSGLPLIDAERPSVAPSEPSAPRVPPTVPPGAILALLALASIVGVALQGCPRLPPVSGCDPGAHRCADDRPEVCSATRRWHPVGDLACAAVGGVCVDGLSAHCAPVDGGFR